MLIVCVILGNLGSPTHRLTYFAISVFKLILFTVDYK